MADFSSGFVTAGAGSSTLPIASIFGHANRSLVVRQIGITNTTDLALQIAVRRVTAAGTPGTSRPGIPVDDPDAVSLASVFDTHSVAPTFVTGNLKVAQLGATTGSGVIFTFPGRGLVIPNSTAAGVVVVPLGTGQVCTVYIDYSE